MRLSNLFKINNLNTRQRIGSFLTWISMFGLFTIRETKTGAVCKFGETCVETTFSTINNDKLVTLIIMIIIGAVLWFYPSKNKDNLK